MDKKEKALKNKESKKTEPKKKESKKTEPVKKQKQVSPYGRMTLRAYELIGYYDHKVFRAFLIAFIRTAVLSFLTVTVFKNINRSNEFFALFVPIFLFFLSSVFKYCYLPDMSSPYIYNMAFFYSGLIMVVFNVFAHNAVIGMLSRQDIPGAVIVIVPCILVALVIYVLAMKLDVSLMKRLREKCGRIFSRKNDTAGKNTGKNNTERKNTGKNNTGKTGRKSKTN